MHGKGYIHRDIKPANFLIGRPPHEHTVYMVDFGLAKRYRETGSTKHIAYKEDGGMVGTLRFSSVNSQLGIEQSRRDDLESLGLMLVYLAKGSLPWQDLGHASERYQDILDKKVETPAAELCRGLEPEFATYVDYCRGLTFEADPDYAYMRQLFSNALVRLGHSDDLLLL